MASPHEIEVTFASARGLKNVNWRYGPTRPYVVVWVDPMFKCSTKADDDGDTDPTWDETLVIPLHGPVDDETTLFADVVHAAGPDEMTKPLIGSARLRLREALQDVGFGEHYKRMLQLKRPSGRPQGKVDVKVLIKESRHHAHDPYQATSYRVAPAAAAAPPPTYGYPYAMQPSPPYPYYASPPTGYPYGAYNYNAPPPPPYGQAPYGEGSGGGGYYYGQEEKKSKMGGMGVGTGIAVGAVAGVLGGIALVEGVEALEDHIADEAAERVEEDLLRDDVGCDEL